VTDDCYVNRYSQQLAGEGTKHQSSNAEVQHNVARSYSPIVDNTIFQLQQTALKLRQAFNGQDTSRADTGNSEI
jgi:hypothetical protein